MISLVSKGQQINAISIGSPINNDNRLFGLDYLRGLAALGILIYHYLSWSFSSGKFSADTFVGRVGIYGVAIFYVLSGLTLYYVYFTKMKPSIGDISQFFQKRVFRIFPLLWLVTFISILLVKQKPDFYAVFLNLTGLFGFVKWDTYFATGAWSIGNELVFYVFFPFFVLFAKSSKLLMTLLCVIIFVLFLYFSFVVLKPGINLANQWRNYVNPLNQVFLFLSGFLIGYLLKNVVIKDSMIFLLIAISLGIFIFYPIRGNQINLVTGINRLILTGCCFIICIGFYKLNNSFSQIIHKPLILLGETSYSVYLLHPIIYKIVDSFIGAFHFTKLVNAGLRLSLSVSLTLALSYLVYQKFEKYFMKFSKKKILLAK